jgi:hypothetical protein
MLTYAEVKKFTYVTTLIAASQKSVDAGGI